MRHCGVWFTTQMTRLLLEIMHLSKNITFASTYVNIPGGTMVVAGVVDNKIGSISDTCKFPPMVKKFMSFVLLASRRERAMLTFVTLEEAVK